MIEPTLKELDDEIERLTTALKEAKQRKRNALLAAAGIKAGDVVKETKARSPRTGVVLDAANEWAGSREKPWVLVQVIKKDGTLGDRQANFYRDWEKVDNGAEATA